MSYTKTNWQTGDVITSAKLNHMEDGIANAGGTLVIGGFGPDDNGDFFGTSDKTWQEIHDALAAGKECIAIIQNGDSVVRVKFDIAKHSDETYSILGGGIGGITAECHTSEGYPTNKTV